MQRGKLARRDKKEQAAAAAKMQAVQRGRIARAESCAAAPAKAGGVEDASSWSFIPTTIDSMMVRPYILTTAARVLIQTDLSRTETADLASNNTITHPPIVYVVGLYGEMVKPRNFI